MKTMKYNVKTGQSKFLSGALILMISGIVCKFIGAFYRVPLSNILGAEGIGIYQLIFPVFSLFLIIISGGIPVALSKLVAECRARSELKRAKRFLLIAFCYLLLLSLIFACLFLFLNKNLASLQGNLFASTGYLAVSITIVFASLLTAFRGYFQGFQIMYPTAVSQIIEQVFKLVLGLVLARFFLHKGIQYGVFGALLGIAISEALALIYLIITYGIKKQKTDIIEPDTTNKLFADVLILLKRSFPIMLNSLILPLILALDSFLVINLLTSQGFASADSTALFGVYSGMVNSLINFPTVISLAIGVSIIPALAYEEQKGNNSISAISTCIKFILLISIPCVLVYMLFAGNIISILYPNATNANLLNVGATLLRLSAVNILFISFLQVSTSILQAVNKSFIPLINLILAGAVKIVLTFILVNSPMHIYGASIASIMCYLLSAGLNLFSLKTVIKFNVGYKSIINILFATGIAVSFIVGIYNLLGFIFSTNLSFVFAVVFGVITYMFAMFFFPVFTDEELKYIPYGSKINMFGKRFTKASR